MVSKVRSKEGVVAERWPRTHNLCPLECFKFLPFLKIFVTDFSEPKKARKLKVCRNMDNDWLYHVYRNRDKGSITLVVMSLGRFLFSTHLCLTSLMAL